MKEHLFTPPKQKYFSFTWLEINSNEPLRTVGYLYLGSIPIHALHLPPNGSYPRRERPSTYPATALHIATNSYFTIWEVFTTPYASYKIDL